MGFRGVARVGARAAIAVGVAALFLGAAGCSADSSPDRGEQPPENALSEVDPCSIMKPEKAERAGFPAHGKPNNDISSQPGCKYDGEFARIGVYRFAGDTLEELGKRSVWNSFKPLKVNGRDGAEAQQHGSTGNQCNTAISAGGGVVVVDAIPVDPRKPFDACAESMKVAELIEPDLPK